MQTLIAKMAFCCAVLILVSSCASTESIPEEVLAAEAGAEAVAEIEAAPEPAPVPMIEMCSPEQNVAFTFRKKVAVLAAGISHPQSAQDLLGLEVAWSESLQKAYSESGRLLAVDASDVHLYIGEGQREWVIELATKLNVQFLVVVNFNNLHVNRKQFGIGEYSVPLPIMRRDIDTEVFVFDGYSGTRMARFTYGAFARGFEYGVVNPKRQPVMMGAFFNTPLGRAMEGLLVSQAQETVDWLACIPLMERVSRVSGNTLYVRATGASMLRPGDSLQLFRRRGELDSHLGPVDIVKVFPDSVVAVYKGTGTMPSSALGLRVRAW